MKPHEGSGLQSTEKVSMYRVSIRAYVALGCCTRNVLLFGLFNLYLLPCYLKL